MQLNVNKINKVFLFFTFLFLSLNAPLMADEVAQSIDKKSDEINAEERVLDEKPDVIKNKYFGVTFGETSKDDLSVKYGEVNVKPYIEGLTTVQYTGNALNFSGLKSVSYILDQNEKVVGVESLFKKDNFDKIGNLLKIKYKLQRYSGNNLTSQSYEFMDKDEVLIILDNPRGSEFVFLNYFSSKYQKSVDRFYKKKELMQRKREIEIL